MPGENIQDWSTTAASNATADSSINWAEGQSRASVNNSARSMMAAHAKDRNLQNGSIVTSGTANAQTFFSGVTYTTVPTGLRVLLKIGLTLNNTAAATLEMDGLGAVAIKSLYGTALTGGEILAGSYVEFLYDGTNWILLGPGAALSLISSQTATTPVTSLAFTDMFTGTYTHYIFDCIFTTTLDGATVIAHVSIDNGANWITVGTYNFSYIFVSLGTPAGSFSAASAATGLQVSPTLPTAGFEQFCIMDIMQHGYHNFRSFGYSGTIGNYTFLGSGLPGGGLVVNALRFTTTTGLLTGTFKMYGVRG